jgi:diacylglycerol kinase family enzyme
MRILLIHNPKAGDRKHSRKKLIAALTNHGHRPSYQSTKKRGWKKALKKPIDVVIAAGGDGTVQKIAWQIMGSGIPLSILPLGTANNLARSLGFTASVEEIIQSLDSGKQQPFDVGVVRGSSRARFFLEAAGGGLFADYFRAADKLEKKGVVPEEKLGADLSLLHELAFRYPARGCKMRLDAEDISDRYILWGAMNIHSAGPALHLAPKARSNDGRLDFVAVREDERPLLIKYLEARLAGRQERLPLMARKFSELFITSPLGAIHLDGKILRSKTKSELKTPPNIEITVKPAALTIWKHVTQAR